MTDIDVLALLEAYNRGEDTIETNLDAREIVPEPWRHPYAAFDGGTVHLNLAEAAVGFREPDLNRGK